MPVHNNDISKIFNKVADLLEIADENQFRIRAYRNAARTIAGLSKNIADIVEHGEDLTQFSGIGEDLAGKIKEIVETGTLKQLEDLEEKVPEDLSNMMKIADLGPKRVKQIHQELGIKTLEELEQAVKNDDIKKLKGFGDKIQTKIKDNIERRKKGGQQERFKLHVAEKIAQPLLKYLKNTDRVKQVVIAGSYRRHKETVGDIDILVTCKRGTDIIDRFVNYEDVDTVVSKGDTRSTVILRNNFQVDLRVVQEDSYGAALLYFTGSKAHNVKIRKMANERDLKINEYGVFNGADRIASETEDKVYQTVDLTYIEPELREDLGEIKAAQDNKLPELITLKDIKGDLQSHTKATDGKFSLEEMADAAKEKGYEYLAITDHSKRVTVAKGLDEKRLRAQLEKINELNEKYNGFKILKSVEVDILKDGSLDLSDDVLKELDIVIASVHYNLNLSKEKQTNRVLRAMDNKYFNILAHPTGRLIGQREPMDIDLENVLKAAKENGCFVELNAQPDRLDLSDVYCKLAKEMGVKIAISTDAHARSDLDNMKYGVYQAQRGWLESKDVLNTRSWSELKKLIKRT